MKVALSIRNLKSDIFAIDELDIDYECSDTELDSMLRAYPEIISAIFDSLNQE